MVVDKTEKIYIWTKFRFDLFETKKLQLLETIEDGEKCVLFYLKLIALSTKNNGFLMFNETVSYNNNILSKITKTDQKIVDRTIKQCQLLKLIEKKDNVYYIVEFESLVGPDTYAAIKKQESRNGIHAKNLDNVKTMSRQCLDNVNDKDTKIVDNVKESIIVLESKNLRTKDLKELNNLKDIVEQKSSTMDNELIPFKQIINYLNLKANTNFRHTSIKAQKFIKARWNEKYTLDDFITVIDIKCEEWLNDFKYNKHLRPETLFGNKFDGYLNQKTLDAIINNPGVELQELKTDEEIEARDNYQKLLEEFKKNG